MRCNDFSLPRNPARTRDKTLSKSDKTPSIIHEEFESLIKEDCTLVIRVCKDFELKTVSEGWNMTCYSLIWES